MTAIARATNCHPNRATTGCQRLVAAGLLAVGSVTAIVSNSLTTHVVVAFGIFGAG